MKRFFILILMMVACGVFFGCGDASSTDDGEAQTLGGATFKVQPVTPVTSSSNPDAKLPQPALVTMKSTPLRKRLSVASDRPLFSKLPSEQTGVVFVNPIDLTESRKYLYHSGFACGGVAIGDVSGDGLPDLFFVGGPGANKLFIQEKDLKFKEAVGANVSGGEAWGAGVAMVDINADGLLDIYVCNYDSPNQLFMNRGDGTFFNQAKAYGLDIVDASLMPAFCDYDRDGDLDVFILTNRYERPGGLPEKMPVEKQDGKLVLKKGFEKYYELRFPPAGGFQVAPVSRADRLLKNNGDGSFSDVSKTAGISNRGDGLSVTWWDYNSDGLTDIYVGNDFEDPDHLYRNNGDGTFSDVLAKVIPHTAWFSMGADVGDLDGDGRLDMLSADMSAMTHYMQKTTMGTMGKKVVQTASMRPPQFMRNALYLNTGTDRFLEAANLAGLADSGWTWAVKLADFDNDTRTDVFLTNGMTRSFNDSDRSVPQEKRIGHTEWDLYETAGKRKEQNLVYRNQGDLRFIDMSQKWGLAHHGISFAAAYADLDRDGDLDLVVANIDEPATIYRNNTQQGNAALIRLKGNEKNTYGLGSVVRIETASGKQVRQLIPTTGFSSSNDSLLHFGLGQDTVIKKITIDWPNGRRQVLSDLPANQLYEISQYQGDFEDRSQQKKVSPLFARQRLTTKVKHTEKPFDDFKRQPLLPNKLSQLGPGVAFTDVDGDGDDDLFVGGAAGQEGRLLLNSGTGQLEPSYIGALTFDAEREDMAPLFFDADGDGDQDLYVVSGGVECQPNAEILRDRFYLNDGKGRFKRTKNWLPDLRDSGSCAVASDFDGDGDLDLFVGSRVVPGQYPISPNSRLLRNEGNRFVDITDSFAVGLRSSGMVTSALWSDADGDGDADLLVTHDWGPVRLWRNNNGKLIDDSKTAGLLNHLGWWNGINGADVDHDGDIDYIVTNFGLNTKYHASREKPLLVYYGDMDGSGKQRIIEAEFEGSICYPIRGKSCSTHAIPGLADKFKTYKQFAGAPLDKIYAPIRLNQSKRFEVNQLQTGMLINDGKGRFAFRALPRLAQISPGFGIVCTDANGDGHVDLYIAQNFFSPQLETGRMDSGQSLLLTGRGDGTFNALGPLVSGLSVPGDGKGLAGGDLNGDGWTDFAVGVNDDELMIFHHTDQNTGQKVSHYKGSVVTVRLVGPASNRQGIGAIVTLIRDDGVKQTSEVYAGGGYLSQSTSELTFGLGSGSGFGNSLGSEAKVKQIEVRWPSGKVTVHRGPFSFTGKAKSRIVIPFPTN